MVLFVSDLHLSADRPQITELFLDFLRTQAPGADALYVLGDLFEAWLGDDIVLPEYEPVLQALADLTRSGVPVSVQRGNRDFLLGEDFARRTGCRLMDDAEVVQLPDGPALLMHGDTLCIDDIPYQQMRNQLRDPAWIAGFLAKSPEERIAFAKDLRERSRRETGEKAEAIMDVNQGAVCDAMQAQGVHRLIHGHTHRLHHHHFTLDGAPAERIVLGDWGETGSAVICNADGCRITTVTAAD
jgi:UDP-2,3-diacylglucosamine hydrolase